MFKGHYTIISKNGTRQTFSWIRQRLSRDMMIDFSIPIHHQVLHGTYYSMQVSEESTPRRFWIFDVIVIGGIIHLYQNWIHVEKVYDETKQYTITEEYIRMSLPFHL